MIQHGKQVTILMGTYNGAKFIGEQLDSIEKQDYNNWNLVISDDGSTDSTLDILANYRDRWGPERLSIVPGPRKGFCQNFLSLTDREDVHADYVAWSDQDDVWLPEKLSRAVSLLYPLGQVAPALYCGRTAIMDDNNIDCGLSPLRSNPPPEFTNALVQSLAGGNTMLFNRPARELIRKGRNFNPVSHDWWAYQVVSGSGGQVIYDPKPTVLYRQHGKNAVGSNQKLSALASRIKKAWTGTFKEMNSRNLNALESMSNKLTVETRTLLASFSSVRHGFGRIHSLKVIRDLGIYRRSLFQQMSLYFGIFMRRV